MEETEEKPRPALLGLLTMFAVIAGTILFAIGLVKGIGYLIGF